MARVSIIAAIGDDRALGKDNGLLWHIPEDFAYFKKVTAGAPVIMGRMTYLSLPERFRPLPGRHHVVIMREGEAFADGDHADVDVVHGISDALTRAQEIAAELGRDEVFVLGGASIYEQMLEHVDRLYITEVHARFPDADVFFPVYENIFTKEVSRESKEDATYKFDFVVVERLCFDSAM